MNREGDRRAGVELTGLDPFQYFPILRFPLNTHESAGMNPPGFLKELLKNVARQSNTLGRILDERDRLRNEVVSLSQERDRLQQRLASIDASRNSGYCHCCRTETTFQINGEWLRDQYICLKCSSIPRQRHIQYILDTCFQGWEEQSIHESSPSNDLISRYCKSYSSSQYLEGVAPGAVVNGIRCENLERLTFPDNSFDLFITQDVFEHIFHPERAAREISRVLKPGGAHVFTAPKHKGLRASIQRARWEGSRVEHLLEAVYHGSPIGDGRALVTWDYGGDFEDLMRTWCGSSVTTYITRDRKLGMDGEYLEVFVTRKS